ncbi:2og-fe oxygenase [Plasmopara halstedii]|uniref:2og-fe oxygenase n=1 Tax=Plasmopara halstedii TaxID=4781 RepID=A0A0N7L7L6_PLAHL|nr:2og-fe oxygenase [Plasmopara halstedii]CEG47419.1 2og-fe oxygenase [Plasmopara halstedii]|eukprot:XP_024583788.1 2og-fe oxygenase [Plasmopara halstedii]
MSDSEIPVISLDDPQQGDKLANAFARFGCCYLTDHGISDMLASQIMHSAASFCALSDEIKDAIPVVHNNKGFTRGYIGMGKESGSAERVEVKEAFSYGYKWPEEKIPQFDNGLQGPNVWPKLTDWPCSHRNVLNEFFRKMTDASRVITRSLSKSLYDNVSFLDKYCQHGETISLMRMFHYFPYEHYANFQQGIEGHSSFDNDREFIGSSPHTDWGFLTLILQDAVGGLQIYHDDKWVDVPYIPGTLVVNAGDYLSLITDGKCLSPVHRVVADNQERYSLVFFYYPDFDAVIPSITDVTKLRIGGDARNASEDSKYFNNLLDGTVRKRDGCFGEYIMDKWAGVQR